jgi:membrane protein required for beta-lactamase induction
MLNFLISLDKIIGSDICNYNLMGIITRTIIGSLIVFILISSLSGIQYNVISMLIAVCMIIYFVITIGYIIGKLIFKGKFNTTESDY